MVQILEFPELLLAALLTTLLLFRQRISGAFVAPAFLRRILSGTIDLFPASYIRWLQLGQTRAGWRDNTALANFVGLKLMLSVIALLTAFALPPLVSILLSVAIFFVPDLFMAVAVLRRQAEIRHALPQALDLMVLCVDAGLGLDATLKRIASEQSFLNSALSEELATLGKDVLLGMDRERAYAELFNRTGVEELKMLGSALNQSARLGIAIAKVLRAQSEFIRTRLFQKAEEKALKLPIWMSFPLWFCIMPALMLVLIGPSIILFFQQVNHFPKSWF